MTSQEIQLIKDELRKELRKEILKEMGQPKVCKKNWCKFRDTDLRPALQKIFPDAFEYHKVYSGILVLVRAKYGKDYTKFKDDKLMSMKEDIMRLIDYWFDL